jgi:hypothetical protein
MFFKEERGNRTSHGMSEDHPGLGTIGKERTAYQLEIIHIIFKEINVCNGRMGQTGRTA